LVVWTILSTPSSRRPITDIYIFLPYLNFMPNSSPKNPLQRFLLIGSGLVFLGLMVIPFLGGIFSRNPQTTPNAAVSQNPEAQKQLLEIAKGYEQVLKREPNNLNALQGLAEANIKLGNYYGALPPLEKLHQMNPNNPQVMLYLAEVRVQTGDKSGGIKLLEAFVQQYPDVPIAKTRLDQLKSPAPAPTK
jgi:tetratricopeptide (TPR) repeat protein